MITIVAFIAAATIGAVLRWEVGRPPGLAGALAGTAAVNLAGSFCLGLLHGRSGAVVTVVGVGGLGALTTFSTYATDTLALIRQRWPVLLAVYGAGTIVGCVALAGLGLALAR